MLPWWSTTAGGMMLPERRMFEDEACPVPVDVLGEMYRANPHGLNELILSVPPVVRGMLAMYCYRRAHLASIALAIAATCEEDDLTRHGGNAALGAASSRAPQSYAGERHAPQYGAGERRGRRPFDSRCVARITLDHARDAGGVSLPYGNLSFTPCLIAISWAPFPPRFPGL
jgi:hypothetical protein